MFHQRNFYMPCGTIFLFHQSLNFTQYRLKKCAQKFFPSLSVNFRAYSLKKRAQKFFLTFFSDFSRIFFEKTRPKAAERAESGRISLFFTNNTIFFYKNQVNGRANRKKYPFLLIISYFFIKVKRPGGNCARHIPTLKERPFLVAISILSYCQLSERKNAIFEEVEGSNFGTQKGQGRAYESPQKNRICSPGREYGLIRAPSARAPPGKHPLSRTLWESKGIIKVV